MKKCHDCGELIPESLWRCQDYFGALWPERKKERWTSRDQRQFLERLASQRKEREQRLAEEQYRQQIATQDNQEKTDTKEKGKIYFISDEHERVKIGYSNRPKKRLKSLQSANADALTLMMTISGDRETESAIQDQFVHLRIRDTEWFMADPALLNYISELDSS